MTSYRSTTLRMAEKHCAATLDLYDAGAEADWSATDRGTAAHAVLHAAGLEADRRKRGLREEERHTLASEVVVKLTTEGRTFDGKPEPPLSWSAANEGATLALDWLAEHGELVGQYELPLAMTAEGKATPYGGPAAWWQGILDYVGFDDANLERALVVRDYKSYWSAGAAELSGVQLRGQAVLAHANGLTKGCDVVRIEVANLRSLSLVSETLYLGHETGLATLNRWRLHLARLIGGLERMRAKGGGFPASPGPACYGCPYLGVCEAAGRYLYGQGLPKGREERARLYAVLDARRDQVQQAVRGDTESGPVSVGDQLLGHHREEIKTVGELIGQELVSRWAASGGDAPGLIYAMRPTAGNLRKVAQRLFPKDVPAQDQWLDTLWTTGHRTRFGWRPITNADLVGATEGEEAP